MYRAILTGLAAGAFTPAAACPGGSETVLSCLVGGSQRLELCLSDTHASYLFGVPGEMAELALAEPIETIAHHPWMGVGRSIWESTTFRNGDYAYEVYISLDRLSEDHETESGVIVWRGEDEIAQLSCDPGTDVIGLWAVTDAKAAAGLCWQPEIEGWAGCRHPGED